MINFRDIITETFQNEIQHSFSLATGFGVVFTDAEGRHIGSGANFCKFCEKLNETPEGAQCCTLSNKHAIEIALKTNKPCVYICHAGLVNIEIPLIYNNQNQSHTYEPYRLPGYRLFPVPPGYRPLSGISGRMQIPSQNPDLYSQAFFQS